MATYASDDSIESLAISGDSSNMTAGTLIGLNHEIRTDNGHMEIRSHRAIIYRLETNTTFSVQQTIEGEVPIFYGKVYMDTLRADTIVDGGKYRTSCYIPSHTVSLTENIDPVTDHYYALNDPFEIMEYDEQGREFQIASVAPFTKLDLRFNNNLVMREKYQVVSRAALNDEEIDSLYSEWVSPVNWK